MLITSLTTTRLEQHPNLLLLEAHDADGRVGLGETFYGAEAVEVYVHAELAPLALGRPAAPRELRRLTEPTVGYAGTGVESRARSALDMAVWDLWCHQHDTSLAAALGGPVRTSLPAYNTCAGADYIRRTGRQETANWGVKAAPTEARPRAAEHPREGEAQNSASEDLGWFLRDPAGLAEDLVAEGYRAMKVWPFDPAAERSGGTWAHPVDTGPPLASLRAIRDAVGDEMDLIVELHGLWDGAAVNRIGRALAELRPLWVEDGVRPDRPSRLADLRRQGVPVAAGEGVGGPPGQLGLLRAGAVDVLIADIAWTGGVTAAVDAHALATAHGVPLALHDCTGPVSFAATVQVAAALPGVTVQESVRAFLRGWYPSVADGVPQVHEGSINVTSGTGHGATLRPGLAESRGVQQRCSKAAPGPVPGKPRT